MNETDTSVPTKKELMAAIPGGLAPEEKKLMIDLIIKASELQSPVKAIPDETSDDELIKYLHASTKTHGLATRISSSMHPLIGRMVILIQKKQLYRTAFGYDTFDQFMTDGMENIFHMARASAYAAKATAESFPSLSAERYQHIGPDKMRKVRKTKVKEGDTNAEALLEKAETSTTKELDQYIAEKFAIAPAATQDAVFLIHCTKEELKIFQDFYDDPDIQRVNDSTNRATIHMGMIQECSIEWKADGQQQAEQFERGEPVLEAIWETA